MTAVWQRRSNTFYANRCSNVLYAPAEPSIPFGPAAPQSIDTRISTYFMKGSLTGFVLVANISMDFHLL